MPLIVPSHQAAVLPFKIWRPAAFSGLALTLGSVAPDLEFMLRLDRDWLVSHTFAAQFYFTVPLVLLLHGLITRLLLPFALPLLPPGPPLHLEALRALRPLGSPREIAVASYSAALGGVTHVMLDGFTHGNHSGWAVAHLPLLATPVPHPFGPLPLHDVLQVWLSIFFAVAALQGWQDLARSGRLYAWRGEAPPPRALAPASPRVRRRTVRFLGLAALMGAVLTLALREADTTLARLELALFGAIGLLAYGVVVAAAVDRWLRSLGRRRLVRWRPVLDVALGS
jgi:hypothetical protein